MCSTKKLGKLFTGVTYTLLLSFLVISDVYRSFFQTKLHLLSTVFLSGFKSCLGANGHIIPNPPKFISGSQESEFDSIIDASVTDVVII